MSKAQELIQRLEEVAPPGFEGTVLAMKAKHPEIKNPWRLAWYLKNTVGAHSHYTKTGRHKRE